MNKIISIFITESLQNRKEAMQETNKMLENIKLESDNYDIDSRIKILSEKERVEEFKLKYRCFVTYDNTTKNANHNYKIKDKMIEK